MRWVYDDGGRAAAGFKGTTGDCTTRAIAIATQRPYLEVYNDLNEFAWATERRKKGSSARTGVYTPTIRRYMEAIGWDWTPTMSIGSGCQVHLRDEELPAGRIICSLSRHTVALVDHVIRDTFDPRRGAILYPDPERIGRFLPSGGESRCVYGYWSRPA